MRIGKVIVLMACAFTLLACATTAKYAAVCDTWLGHNINELVNAWGYPQSSFDAPNGNKVYVYSKSGSFTMPTQYQTTANVYGSGNYAYGTSTTNVYGGQTFNFSCNTFFEVNSSNIIVIWRAQGNNCVSQ